MNKHMKRILSILTVFAICMLLIPQPVSAASTINKYQSAGAISMNTYFTVKESSYKTTDSTTTHTHYAYKLTVPANGYIKITRADTNGIVYLLPTLSKCSKKKGIYDNALDSSSGKKTDYMVVSAGTYYISSSSKTRLKVKFTKSVPTANYCKARAVKLASGTTKVICMNKGYEYDRWYKINLTTKKRINVTFKNPCTSGTIKYPNFTVYNSAGKVIECPLYSSHTYRTKSVAKGTYYIRVYYTRYESDPSYTTDARLFTMKWK